MLDRLIDAIFVFGFPLGVLVGFVWRDRISRARRARYLYELNKAARAHLAEEKSDKQSITCTTPSASELT